jgi:hypothetical protein
LSRWRGPPVCLACIELLLNDPEAYWKLLRERRGKERG